MILSLFIESVLFILLGLFFFWKKKPILGVLFVMIGIGGIAVGLIVVSLFPEKL